MMSFCLGILYASLLGDIYVTKVKYEGGISIFGRVAEAELTLEEDNKNKTYKMTVDAWSVGIVKALSSNRRDLFISEGKVVNGVYVPYKFIKRSTDDGELKETTYTFDYDNDRVLKEVYKEEIVEKCSYDIISMESSSKEEVVTSKENKYIKLYKNDFLTMLLNLSADNLKNGCVSYIDKKDEDDVKLLSKSMFEVSKENGDDIYRINFSKENGMFFDKAIAVDIAFYGDAYLKKVYEEKSIIN
jgi:hypothetical protein